MSHMVHRLELALNPEYSEYPYNREAYQIRGYYVTIVGNMC